MHPLVLAQLSGAQWVRPSWANTVEWVQKVLPQLRAKEIWFCIEAATHKVPKSYLRVECKVLLPDGILDYLASGPGVPRTEPKAKVYMLRFY